jgi:hypothetical protein
MVHWVGRLKKKARFSQHADSAMNGAHREPGM